MAGPNYAEAAEFIRNNVRLKTLPLAVKFLKEKTFPEKTRQPSVALGKRVAVCQAVSMARLYGWTVGLAKEDLICVPAGIAFGFSSADDTAAAIGKLFCGGAYARTEETGTREGMSICRLGKDEYAALLIAPLARAAFEPDIVVIYGNPAQVMRFVQAWSWQDGERIVGNFGGKIECGEYLIAPFKEQKPRVAVPGMGDRVFSLTQDDEMVFSLPAKGLPQLVTGLQEAGKKVGAGYPVTFFLNFQPEFPPHFKAMGKELGLF
jgi:uncharacterized protein (DUF169 family)